MADNGCYNFTIHDYCGIEQAWRQRYTDRTLLNLLICLITIPLLAALIAVIKVLYSCVTEIRNLQNRKADYTDLKRAEQDAIEMEQLEKAREVHRRTCRLCQRVAEKRKKKEEVNQLKREIRTIKRSFSDGTIQSLHITKMERIKSMSHHFSQYIVHTSTPPGRLWRFMTDPTPRPSTARHLLSTSFKVYLIVYDAVSLLFDVYFVWQLESGELLDHMITRNTLVLNLMLGISMFGAFRCIMITGNLISG